MCRDSTFRNGVIALATGRLWKCPVIPLDSPDGVSESHSIAQLQATFLQLSRAEEAAKAFVGSPADKVAGPEPELLPRYRFAAWAARRRRR